MPSRLLDNANAVDVTEEAQAEALRAARIREAVHRERGLTGVEGLPDASIQLVVGDGAPEGRLRVGDRLHLEAGVGVYVVSSGTRSTGRSSRCGCS